MKERKLKQKKMNVTKQKILKENRFYFTIYKLTERSERSTLFTQILLPKPARRTPQQFS